MNKIIKCSNPEHQENFITGFCYHENCQMPTRLLCDQCVYQHHGHLMTTLNIKISKAGIQNMRINYKNSSNYPNSQANIHDCLGNIIEKFTKIINRFEKFKQQTFINHLNFMTEAINNSFREDGHIQSINKIMDTDKDQLDVMAKAIRCFQREHLKNISLLEESAQCMEQQLSKVVDPCFEVIEQTLDKIQEQVNRWSLFQVSDYKPKIEKLNQFKELRILANKGGWNPINQWIGAKKQLETIQQLQMVGNNNEMQFCQPNINQNITKIEGINCLLNLKRLTLKCNIISKIQKIDGLTKLQNIDLSQNKITKIQGLENLTNLRKLWLNYNLITKIQNLESLTNLTTLDLRVNQITKIQNLQSLTNLTTLDLGGNQITKIQNLQSLTNLTTLDLRVNQITKIQNLQSLTNLTTLDLENNPLIDSNKNNLQKDLLKKRVQYCYF